MKQPFHSITALLVGIALATTAFVLPRHLGKEPHLPPPDYLPTAARELLSARMHRHAEDMIAIAHSVPLLDFATTVRLADEVVAEPTLARPVTGDATELNTQMPARFFVLQDELSAAAKSLGAAARAQDAEQVALGYSKLTATCVSCHSIYVRGTKPTPSFAH